jgi:hypothetical protein
MTDASRIEVPGRRTRFKVRAQAQLALAKASVLEQNEITVIQRVPEFEGNIATMGFVRATPAGISRKSAQPELKSFVRRTCDFQRSRVCPTLLVRRVVDAQTEGATNHPGPRRCRGYRRSGETARS